MVYVYAKKSEINKYVGQELEIEDIKQTLVDMGMDIKGEGEGDDPELKIEITAEKIDMVSAVGVARAIKYYRGIKKEVPRYNLGKSENKLIVKESASRSRPKTVAAIIRNAPMSDKFLDEIITIQEKIHDSFGRGRKKAAIGIYPIDLIKFPITYGSEKPQDIRFRPLESKKEMNGEEILQELDTGKKFAHLLKGYDAYPVFRDDNGEVLSMPPIINSHKTGRVEKYHKDLFVECSGYNLQHLDNVLKVLATTFIDMGAKVESMKVEYEEDDSIYELDLSNSFEEIDIDYARKLIGVDINTSEIPQLLNKMMYGIENIENSKKVKIEIPVFKSDVWHDVDIIDDIARAYGYNNITPTFPNISSLGEHLDFSIFKERISETMTRLGFIELYTYMLSSTTEHFKKMGLDEDKESFIRITDSAEQGINMVRPRILPDNLTSLHLNRKNKYPQKVFETGLTVMPDEKSDTQASNQWHLSVSIADPRSNYTEIKGILDTLMKLNQIEYKVEKNNTSFLIEGRRAEILVRGHPVGFIGELHPQVLENFGLIVPVSSLEINLTKLYDLIK